MERHEDETLPPQLREALRVMARRGPVVELTGPARVAEEREAGEEAGR
jgi:hypothetical protein